MNPARKAQPAAQPSRRKSLVRTRHAAPLSRAILTTAAESQIAELSGRLEDDGAEQLMLASRRLRDADMNDRTAAAIARDPKFFDAFVRFIDAADEMFAGVGDGGEQR